MTITKTINLPDGRVLTHHTVSNVSINVASVVASVTVSSWESSLHADAVPALKTQLDLKYDVWTTEHFDAVDISVMGHPEWSGVGQARTSALHTWSPVLSQWVEPPLAPLQELKDAKWMSIKQARTTAIDAPLVTPYGTVDSKAKDRTNITDAVLLLQTLAAIGTPTTIDFTLADNSTVTLTTTEMVTVGLLLGQKVQAAHATARTLRTAIDAVLTSEALEEITWPI